MAGGSRWCGEGPRHALAQRGEQAGRPNRERCVENAPRGRPAWPLGRQKAALFGQNATRGLQSAAPGRQAVLHVDRERRWDGRKADSFDRPPHWKGWGRREVRRASRALDRKARHEERTIRPIIMKTTDVSRAVVVEVSPALSESRLTLAELPPTLSELAPALSEPRMSRSLLRTPLSVDRPSRSANRMSRWHVRAPRSGEPPCSFSFLLRRSEERMTRLSISGAPSARRSARSEGIERHRALLERLPEGPAPRPDNRVTAPTLPVTISNILSRRSASRASISLLHASLSVFPTRLSVLRTRSSVLSATKAVRVASHSTIPAMHS
jgi:hypothetical protein